MLNRWNDDVAGETKEFALVALMNTALQEVVLILDNDQYGKVNYLLLVHAFVSQYDKFRFGQEFEWVKHNCYWNFQKKSKVA